MQAGVERAEREMKKKDEAKHSGATFGQ